MQLKQDSTLQGGKYRIEKVIGQGGFGITYLAEQTIVVKGGIGEIKTKIKVTIKEFFMKEFCNRDEESSHVSVPSAGSREFVGRFKTKFLKEAQNIAKLNHDNIIKVLDVFEENDTAYYVMEYIDGGSLNDHIACCEALVEREAVHYIRQIADALGYIHKLRINHLDVKPSNILIKEGAVAVLIDFGLAKQYDKEGDQTSSTPVGVSKGYAPMEQYKAGGVSSFSPASDIYSLGATLYKLVTGTTPPESHDLFDNGLPELPSELSADAKRAITMAMQPSRNSRPQSIAEFLDILGGGSGESEETAIIYEPSFEPKSKPKPEPKSGETTISTSEHEHEHEHETTTPKPKNSNKGLIICTLIAVIVATIGGYYFISSQTDTTDTTETKDAAEQFYLGDTYFYGIDVEQDYNEAAKWYKKAAEQGDVDAQYALGLCYQDGTGVTKSESEAVKWYQKAAEQGYEKAIANLKKLGKY